MLRSHLEEWLQQPALTGQLHWLQLISQLLLQHSGSSTMFVHACLLPKLVGGTGGSSSTCHFSVFCNRYTASCQLLAWQTCVVAAGHTHNVLAVCVTPSLSVHCTVTVQAGHNVKIVKIVKIMHAVPVLVTHIVVWAHELM
jgi:hypothetical protein